MDLREFLEQREQELRVAIDVLHEQTGKLQAKLRSTEAELSEVRRAKAAIGVVEAVGTAHAISTATAKAAVGTLNATIEPITLVATGSTGPSRVRPSPYANLTMKQLV